MVTRHMAATFASAGAVLWMGCAQQEAPSGGPEDLRPPVVVRTDPPPFGLLEDLSGEVRFTFDERISERVSGGTLEGAVSVSPRTGGVRVSHGSREISVKLEDGFLPDLVYRVTLLPVVSDLFGNRLTDSFELVFTTGDVDPTPTTLAGEVWNRITGAGVSDAMILAVGPDGVLHQSTADRDGIYAFRYLPGGQFAVTAFEDRNRDGFADSTEVQGRVMADLASGDTLLIDVAVLEPDTTSAVAADAEALDSVTVAVTFDDFLDPSSNVASVDVSLSSDSGEAPSVRRLLHAPEYVTFVEVVADSLASLDSIDAAARAAREAAAARERDALAQDSAVGAADAEARDRDPDAGLAGGDTEATGADTLAVDPDTSGVEVEPPPPGRTPPPGSKPTPPPARTPPPPLPRLQGSTPGPTADGRRVLPGRRLVLQLADPLEPDVAYEVRISGVVNINGLPEGGGAVPVILDPPPDSVAADSLGVGEPGAVGDSGALADSGAVADSIAAVDSLGGSRDGSRAPGAWPGATPLAGARR